MLTRPDRGQGDDRGGGGAGSGGEETVVLGDELAPTRQARFEAEVQRLREER